MQLNGLQYRFVTSTPAQSILIFSGEGRTVHMAACYKNVMAEVAALRSQAATLLVDLKAVIYMDSSVALMILQIENELKGQGGHVQVEGSAQQIEYLETIRQLKKKTTGEMPPKRLFSVLDLFAQLGAGVVGGLKHAFNRLRLFGGVLGALGTQRWRWTSINHHIETAGMQALPIIGLVSVLIGAVLAYQGITQLKRFGAEIYTVDFLTISVLRELAVLITSIVVAGRSGSAFAAQIGTMALTQELDAMRVLGISPLSALVAPRMIALLIALPILVFFATLMALIGGMIIIGLVIDLPYPEFWRIFKQTISPSTFWVGIGKAPIFAIVIALIGCQRGLQVRGSSESVGKMTTRAVVDAIFLVIVLDALMSILFSVMGV